MSATSTSGTANQAGFAPLASLRLRLPLICISVNITLEEQVRRLDPVVGEDPHAVVGQLLHRHFEVPASERGNIAAEPGDLLIDEPSLLVEAFHEKLNAPRAGAIHVLHATAHDRCAIPLPRLPIDLEVPFPAESQRTEIGGGGSLRRGCFGRAAPDDQHQGRENEDIPYTTHVRASHVGQVVVLDRKSTRLNSSHSQISYAVFCLKKK